MKSLILAFVSFFLQIQSIAVPVFPHLITEVFARLSRRSR